jgi:hypothetical protein
LRAVALALIACSGCYSPSLHDCQYLCPDNVCPHGQVCANGYCVKDSSTSCLPATDQAMPAVDASPTGPMTCRDGWDCARQNACTPGQPLCIVDCRPPGAHGMYYDALLTCLGMVCAGPCGPAGGCMGCLMEAVAPPGSCDGDARCGACSAQLQSCLAH